jgi:serine/threonine-protein kinase
MRAVDSGHWTRLSALLDELLETEGAQRAERLSQLHSQDPALADELAALLAQQAGIETDQFLEGWALDSPGAGAFAGRSIGSYQLERPIGQGGMGTVWLARRSDGRYEGAAAVKFLNIALVGHDGSERFRREGNALAKLAHPNITHLIDAGVSGGQPYLVLEYVEGEPIDRWCDERALDVTARLRLFLQVLGAVAHAHSRLILHRDLKPSNILVTPDGQVKLLDFGIAKLLAGDAQTVAAAETTLQGHAFTPDYASPEQLLRGETTTATDVYALGVLLHVLLVGTHPTARGAASSVERMRQLVEEAPTRPSDAALKNDPALVHARAATPTQLARTLRGDLDNIVAKALKKSPAERYATVATFADDLQRYLNHQPVSARADSLAYRASRFVRRHRLAVGAASMTALALVAGIVGTTWQAIESRRQRDEALYQKKRAEFQAGFAYQIMSEVGRDGQPITIRQLMEKGIEVLDRHYGDDPRFVMGMLVNISGRYMDLGDTRGEYAALVKAAAIADKLGDPDQIAHVQCNTVETELAAGRPEQAAQRMRYALDKLQQMRAPSFELRTECDAAHARLLWSQGRLDEAIAITAKVAHAIEGRQQTADLVYLTVTSMLQVMLSLAGRLSEALDWNKRNEAAQERAGRSGTVSMSLNQANRAVQLYDGGNVRVAWELQRAIVERLVAQQGVDSVRAGLAYRLGLFQVHIEETDAGIAWIDRAISMAAAKDNRSAQVGALISRAQAQLMLGRLDPAAADLDTAERLAQPNAGEHRIALRTARLLRAQWRMAKGDPAAATQDIDRLLSEIDYPRNKVAPGLARMLSLKARAQLNLGSKAAALSAANEAVAVAESMAIDRQQSADVGTALMVLAQAQRGAGDVDGARASAQRATAVLTASLGSQHSQTIAAAKFD